MKPPGWIVIENERVEGGQYVFDLRVRYWHPGFWLFVARELWRTWRSS